MRKGILEEVDADFGSCRVLEAVVEPDVLAVDWIEDGKRWHLLARSDDGGRTYKGTFGDPTPDENYPMEITRYDGPAGVILLYAKWRHIAEGNEGQSIISLDSDAG